MTDLELKKPKFVLQHNAISRSIYNLSTNARRLMAMAMALLPENGECKVHFSAEDFITALGLTDGAETRKYIIQAIRECLDSHIEIFMPNGDWWGLTWFTESYLGTNHPEDMEYLSFEALDLLHISTKEISTWTCLHNRITMTFNPKLKEVISSLKKAYAKLDLIEFGKLQSKYAIRYYEIAMSYNGFAGKEGNPENNWYFEKSLAEIRKLFDIKKSKYKDTNNFRTRIIDNPIKELNEAKIGIKITIEYIREGKYLVGARFNCKFTDDKLQKSAKKTIQSTEMEEKPTKISPEEFAEMKEKYPAEWEKIREEVSQNYYGGWKSAGVTEKSKSGEAIVDEMTFIRLKEELGL